jgi:RNA polymerase sigma-70 factor, ECF subfamily
VTDNRATEQHDDEILALLRNSQTHERGFRLLTACYQVPLYRHIRRMVGSHEDADDVLQNTLIKVFKNIERFEGKSKLFTWLYRIATNEAITFLSSQKRNQTQTLDNPEHQQVANQLRADAWTDSDYIEKRLHRALETLPERQKAVFQLRYFEEMPYEQMSVILDTSVGSLKASYHHAAKKIEALLIEK